MMKYLPALPVIADIKPTFEPDCSHIPLLLNHVSGKLKVYQCQPEPGQHYLI